MSLMLDEDEYFSLRANVTAPGYIRTALKGYLVSKRSDGTYIAPLLPQLFYGANGQPLTTWRQNITQAGEQVILSRSGGLPTLPREELYWRKVTPAKEEVTPKEVVRPQTLTEWWNSLPLWQKVALIIGGTAAAVGTIYVVHSRIARRRK